MTTDNPLGLSRRSAESTETLVASLFKRMVEARIREDAPKVGIRQDAIDDVVQRALRVFDFTSSGGLAGPNGITPIGWMRYPLKQEAAFLWGDTDSQTPPPVGDETAVHPKETPRQKLARANGEEPFKWT